MATGVDGVVLYIGGGEASHSAELMRMSNFFHFRGQEGWLTASAGLCSEQLTPGQGIRIAPGPFLINSRFPGGAMQSYMGRILTGVDVPTVNVPPGDPRSDLVVLNIEDPYPSDGTFWPYPGESGSDSRRDGPYAKVRVIQGVPSNTLSIDDLPTNRTERGWSCIPIARIDRPQNTGTITNSMIKNLRAVINPWAGIQLPQEILDRLDDIEDAISDLGEGTDSNPDNPGGQPQKFPVPAIYTNAGTFVSGLSGSVVNVSDTTWKTWPTELTSNYIVPPWCTYLTLTVDLISVLFMTGSSNSGVDANVYFGLRYVLGHSVSSETVYELIEPNDVYYAACPDKRPNRPPNLTNLKFNGRMYIDKRDIGKKCASALQVRMIPNNTSRLHNGILKIVPNVTSFYSLTDFKERPN